MDHAAAGGLSDPYVRASMDPEEVLYIYYITS
jgi:hypothetical protein